ncbi:unnamed protein product, partial [Musa acuminata subsp. burmannicoides]
QKVNNAQGLLSICLHPSATFTVHHRSFFTSASTCKALCIIFVGESLGCDQGITMAWSRPESTMLPTWMLGW